MPGYTFESDKLLIANKTAITGAWISKHIKYQRNTEFDDGINSIVAMDIGFPHKKS